MRLFLTALMILTFTAGGARAAEDTRGISFAGHDRPYIVHTPPGYEVGKPHAVVIGLHGGGGHAEQFMRSSGLNDAVDRAGMIAVYPSGYPGKKLESLRTWNAGKCCATAMADGSDDTAYIRAVLDDLPRHYTVDPARIFVTGHSNGAMMAYRLSCELSDRIAAIVPVGGQSVFGRCAPARAIPVLHIHGTADNCATYTGGEQCGGCFGSAMETMSGRESPNIGTMRWPCDPVPESLAARAALYRCGSGPVTAGQDGALTCQRWEACENGATVTLCSIEGAGHAWPGGEGRAACRTRPEGIACRSWRERSGATSSVNAAAMIVDFFKTVK